MLKKIIFTIKTFRETVIGEYGDSYLSYCNYIYYSIFRINKFILFEKDLSGSQINKEIGDGLEIMRLHPESLDKYRNQRKLPREFYCDKFLNAKICYVILDKSELAFIQWIFLKGDKSRFFNIKDYCVEYNYLFTMPLFRGRGLALKALNYISIEMSKQGFKKAVAAVHENNISSVKTFSRAGFKKIKHVFSIGPFNRKINIS